MTQEWVLAQQTKERVDTSFKTGCMLCRTEFSGSRNKYIDHLLHKHNLVLGRPENLVFIDELLDKIQKKVEKYVELLIDADIFRENRIYAAFDIKYNYHFRLICIFCEGVFTSRFALKEHMRKKLHKRLNPDNKEWDKFYVVNYLECKKNREQAHVRIIIIRDKNFYKR